MTQEDVDDPFRLHLSYLKMRSTNVPPAAQSAPITSPLEHYTRGLTTAAAIAAQAVAPATRDRQQTYLTWLSHGLMGNGCLRTIDTCTPEDILVYITEDYLVNHAGAEVHGGLIVAPGSLSAMVSHLRSEMERRGRDGPWIPATHAGNPLKSPAIHEFMAGYSKHVHILGFAQQSAVPMSLDNLNTLLGGYCIEINSVADCTSKALLARDACAICLAWHTHLRGADLCRLQVAFHLLKHPIQCKYPHYLVNLRCNAGV